MPYMDVEMDVERSSFFAEIKELSVISIGCVEAPSSSVHTYGSFNRDITVSAGP